jgi:hypothetical protein
VSRCIDLYWSMNPHLHSDMVVRIGPECHVADTYWLASVANDHENTLQAGRSLYASFCRSAAKEFASLTGDWVRFFPIDFSDQCTKWICVDCQFGHVDLSVGWSSDEAHAVLHKTMKFPERVTDWDTISKSTERVPLSQFCQELNAIADECC